MWMNDEWKYMILNAFFIVVKWKVDFFYESYKRGHSFIVPIETCPCEIGKASGPPEKPQS